MKHAYTWARPLLAALFFFSCFGARAQQAWRPFRPGLIYTYAATPVTSSSEHYTLRVDSAYIAANGDSVYAFNRRLRDKAATTGRAGFARSKNNLFGATLRWNPNQAGYTLEALAQTDVQLAVSLTLFPRAAVGSTWNASSQPLQTATLVSRSWQTISPGVQDTVAVINIANSGIVTPLRLSRRYGLLAGPKWLGGATGGQLEQAVLPARFEQSIYNPRAFFDVQPGDEFGYFRDDVVAPVSCTDSRTLRRVIGRRITADSIIITYQEQRRYQNYGFGSCGPAQTIIYPIEVKRWAVAQAGNQWQPNASPVQPAALRLLTGEYRIIGSSSYPYMLAGLPIAANSGGCRQAAGTARSISYVPYYPQTGPGNSNSYERGIDYLAWGISFDAGLTSVVEQDYVQSYSRTTVNGVTTTCGNPQTFVSLLPTRAAQAAAVATLHPNPAAEVATLTLAQVARPGTTLHLTDALGRTVWSAPVAAGQTALAVPLAGQPSGLYLLHLNGPDGTAVSWKLNHE
ncbi:T9SS type A sorting domain-containing protein [Hymenobacter sp. DH14]|uniref:T9SS type A sorting domain-containing protein n=1 Tax=Hymenobacter cyanobacteriorum TaxID=2926463 RepID=A0A9X1VM78_9BACT|nr:T9SS type A sorting domain-containing protein [Hymenobacter cyanobacteriorum]MCI1189590.1 T9SS type A sorting domain-containing protein [Hymenobacter cyanobacteriorum]